MKIFPVVRVSALGAASAAILIAACSGEETAPGGTTTSTSAATTGVGGAGGQGIGGATGSTTVTTATTTTGTGGAGGAGGSGGGVCAPLGDPCTECVFAACPAVFCECALSVECPLAVTCISDCDGAPDSFACTQDCWALHPTAIADTVLVSGCAWDFCQGACPYSDENTPCETCVATHCEQEVNTCFSDPECTALVTCVRDCPPGDADCQDTCIMNHPDGVTEAFALQSCAGDQCLSECQDF